MRSAHTGSSAPSGGETERQILNIDIRSVVLLLSCFQLCFFQKGDVFMAEVKEVFGKSDLAIALVDALGVTKKHATEAIEAVFRHISREAAGGKKVRIHAFGTFQMKHKEARKARNPVTGAEVDVPAKDVLVFKASQ
jgi:nucleoid DNA-binding protein